MDIAIKDIGVSVNWSVALPLLVLLLILVVGVPLLFSIWRGKR